jgi:tetratricopeptide (TPR) repeat protein/TolB-like protein/predicted Ser/Thr protein kinase
MEGERILHYRVLGPLGQGGMGEVVLAQDERLGRRVALKFLSHSFAADPQARERLQREARSLAALSHPHIAAIHALEESGGRAFLVMEYVEGETLARTIERRPLPVEDVISVALAMAEALAHAHARGVIHRDVKPANILIRGDGSAVLTDFGIADLESATRLTAEGYTPGTVAYMSPEQARGTKVDARSDLFSLGAVLYEALTGARPFAGDRPESALYAVQHREVEPPTARRSGIPLELERIVLKCLKKDPTHRYQHADDLAADLRALRAGLVSPAEAPTQAMARVPAPVSAPMSAAGTGAGSREAGSSTPDAGSGPGRRVRRIAMLTVAALLALALVYLAGRPGSDDHGTAVAAEKSIAVLSFQNLAEPGDPSGTSPMATSLLSIGLGEMQVMPVVSAQRIHVALREMGKTGTKVQGEDALAVARKAGASHVVTGFIYSLAPEVILGAEVASTANGKVLTATRVRAPAGPSALFAAVDSLTRAVCEGLARSGFSVRSSGVDVAGLTTHDPVAYRAYARGLDRLFQGRHEEASQEFQRAVAADSTFALAWYYAAIANWWSGEFLAAEEEVRAALRVGARLTPREREGLQALDMLVRARYDTAVDAYRALLTRYPEDKEFAYGLGEALYHQGDDFPAARSALEQAVRLDPAFGVAYIHLLDIAIHNREFDAAMGYVERYRAADPDYPGAHKGRGQVLAARGDTKGALAAYAGAIEAAPDQPDARFHIMRLHLTAGQFDSARVAMSRLNQLQGRSATIAQQDARLMYLSAAGRYREVIQEFQRLPDRDHLVPSQRFAPVRLYHQTALLEQGNVAAAVAGFRQTIADPNLARTLGRGGQMDELAEVQLAQGKIAEVEALLREYGRIITDHSTWRERGNRDYIAGILALAKGNPGEARRLLETGEPMSPPGKLLAQRARALARAHSALGDTSRAIAELERVVTASAVSHDFDSLFRTMIELASYYERAGRREEALGLYRRVEAQYREADPGFRMAEQARAGIRRLSRPA